MKIGFVLDDSLDKSDGVQQYVLTLGAYYRTQGHEVHYIVGETLRDDIPHVHSLSKNIRAKFNQNRMSTPLPVPKPRIAQLLEKLQLDVLHVQMPYSPLLAARVISFADPKTVIVGTFHIVPFSKAESLATKALGLVLRRNLKRFDAIYSVSAPAQRFAKKAFNIHSEILPNVVNLHHFASAKPLHKYDDDTFTIIFLGRLVERKGCMHLLRAVERLHKQHKLDRVRVVICGKGPLLPELQAYTAKHHLQHIVQFTGFVDEEMKARYLSSADIAVFPSTGGESFGIVLIEAMAAGSKVILAGNNLGYASVMEERTEQVFDPSDNEAFAKLLRHYIVSTAARKKAFAWQQRHVKQFDTRIVGRTLLRVYEQHVIRKTSA